jgi:hypothetical protein
VQRTEGRELLWLVDGGGGCNDGDTAREDFECPFEAWYMGSDGVAALDMLAWPEGQCCAALERGLPGRQSGFGNGQRGRLLHRCHVMQCEAGLCSTKNGEGKNSNGVVCLPACPA